MTRKLKMWVGNYDGRRQGLVIAPTKKRALEVIGIKSTDFDRYWTEKTVDPMLEPEVFYTRSFDSKDPWYRGRCPIEIKRK